MRSYCSRNKPKSNFECAAIAAGINLKLDLKRTKKPSAQDKTAVCTRQSAPENQSGMLQSIGSAPCCCKKLLHFEKCLQPKKPL